MAFGISTELWVILLAVILLFGATAIPKLARSLGKAQGEFQKARGEFSKELDAGRSEATTTTSVPVEEERRIRAAATTLGIETEGRALEDIRRDLDEKAA